MEPPCPNDPLLLAYVAITAILTAVIAAVATRVQLLPDVIDLSFIPTGSGILSLVLVFYGALRRFDPERLGKLALLGTLLGGLSTAAVVLLAVLFDVLS
ncbi:MAG: hypothetical protein ACRDK0_12785 [Solirubrobacteraceae bacterium]